MIKVAIIGASYLQLPVYLKAHEIGFQTIGFAWQDGAVARDYCDRFYPISIVEKEIILEICTQEKIDGILSIASDVAVTTVNYIASKMGLTGNSIESTNYSTNKFLMREKLKNAGLFCPKYFLINKCSDIKSLEGRIDYPVIVKPIDRSGSKGVTKVLDACELEKSVSIALESSFSNQAILEEFIDGVEVSVEMISFEGVHYELAITDKETSGAPHFVELAHHQPSQLAQNIQKEINYTAIKVLNALDIKNGASHPEFIISSDKIIVTEIGARMGGDFIGSDLVFLSTGYDFLKGVLQAAIGNFRIPQKLFSKFSGVYFYSEITQQVGDLIKKGKDQSFLVRSEITSNILMPLKQSSDRSGYLIYQDDKKLVI